MCTGCNTRFTHPNTLKAHMFLQCRQVTLTSPSSTDTLIPFNQLLQTISKKPRGRDSCDKKLEMNSKPEVTTLTTSLSTSLKHTPKGNTTEDALSYRSAFRTLPSTSREVKREQSSDDSLMTPDSSTDQHSALNLSVKTTQNSLSAAKEDPNSLRSWNIFAAQHMMAPSIAVPFEYSSLAGCYPIPSHFHPLEVQLLNSQSSMPSHAYHALLESRNSCSSEYQLSHLDDLQECGALPSSKAHTSSMSPVRHLRNSNPYGFALPSDKEPLDLLPQAYFANKSKKGHLCLCCGKLYSRKYGLKIHMRTHNGYKPLKCKICSRPFGDPSNLNKHVRLHAQGETPYRCEFCGKVLVRRRDLERHVRSRHPMGCVEGDETLPMCESSPDSSPLTVTADSPEPVVTSPHTDISNNKL